jgi:hypothetical protein
MYTVIVVAITDSVLGLVIDFKDVSRRAVNSLELVGQQSTTKE